MDMASVTVLELAQEVGGKVVGDAARVVAGCNTLMDATAEEISLLHNVKYTPELATTRAGCVILAPGAADNVHRAEGLGPLTVIEAKNPYHAWQKVMVRLHGYRRHEAVGISPQAVIHPTAKLGKNVNVHPLAAIGANVTIGDNVNIYPQVTLMRDVSVGDDCILYPGATVYDACVIGKRCIVHAGAVIGSDGYGYAQAGGVHHKIPQCGNVVLEDDVEIGGNSVIERAALQSTVIGAGTKIGNCVVVGHNCHIGAGNLLVSQVGIAGSTTTGKYVVMGGQVGVAGHLDIPDGVKIAAQTGVMTNPEANTEIGGSPAMELAQARRVYFNFMQLPELAKRVKELEKRLKKMAPNEHP
jgi:UDP-3-O-[3-hydroxymyristoyl] glucosamine N-acyltransferase